MRLIEETIEWLRDYVNDCEENSKTGNQARELADALEDYNEASKHDPQLYHVMPDGCDDCDCPTSPDPMPLCDVGAHVALLRGMYRRQGYFSNSRQDHIPLDVLEFRLVPAEADREEAENE